MIEYLNSNAKQPYIAHVYSYQELSTSLIQSFWNGEAYSMRGYNGKFSYKYSILDLCCGFDIETYTQGCNGFMYIWQFAIGNNIIIGRRWSEFKVLINMLIEAFGLNASKRIIIWDANLGYEFQFMRKYLHITDSFSKSERHPLYCTHNGCVEFRDCLPISGGGLANLAENYTNTQKCVGDLDYTMPRNYMTSLSSEELGYCYNDVLILAEWARYIFDTHISHGFVPLTKTQLLIREMKENAVADYGKKGFRNMIREVFPSPFIYRIFFDWVFRGGYVHGNQLYTGHEFDYEYDGVNIISWDITSSYPTRMMNDDYYIPGIFHSIYPNEVESMLDSHCVIFCATFTNIRARYLQTIESKHKCIRTEGAVLDNGRIYSADKIQVALTELDYQSYIEFYEWDDMEIHWAYAAHRCTMPDYVRKVVIKYYEAKARLKEAGEPYGIEKSAVNSLYGAAVKRFSDGNVTYSDEFGWGSEEDPESFLRQISSAVLAPQIGIYIAAHSRRALVSTVYLCNHGDDVLYCDTDSIKVMNADIHQHIFDDINDRMEESNRRMCEKYGLDFNIWHDLGCWDCEGQMLRLKYLGAKRYVRDYIKKGERVTEFTVAGIPKGVLNKEARRRKVDPYAMFEDNLKITRTEKNTSFYNDSPSSAVITDYQGHQCECWEESNIGLVEAPFEMSIDKAWKEVFIQLQQEYKLRFRV